MCFVDKNKLIFVPFEQKKLFFYVQKNSKSQTPAVQTPAVQENFEILPKNVFWPKQINFCFIWAKKKFFFFWKNFQKISKSQTPAVQTPAVQGNFEFFSQKCVSSIFVIFEQKNFVFDFLKFFRPNKFWCQPIQECI